MNRQAYLRAMGIDVWVRRDLPDTDASDVSAEAMRPQQPPEPETKAATGAANAEAGVPGSTTGPDGRGPEERAARVRDGSPEPLRRTRQGSSGLPGTAVPESDDTAAPLDWNALREAVGSCGRCDDLVANRTRTVFSRGDADADWMVIGEAPGADEDRQGEPFVGRAGKLLDQMLLAAGWPRNKVYIANILKCRPPNNRDPRPEEAGACAAYLNRQIELVGPKLILVVGRVAAQNLLQTDAPLARLRDRVHHHEPTGVPVIVTYHPAYLLRTPGDKRKAWTDLKLALTTYRAGR